VNYFSFVGLKNDAVTLTKKQTNVAAGQKKIGNLAYGASGLHGLKSPNIYCTTEFSFFL